MTEPLRSILVHTDGSGRAEERLALARRLAMQQGACLTVLYAATPILPAVPYGLEGSSLLPEPLQEMQAERRANARAAYERAFSGPQPSARWAEVDEFDAAALFSRQAVYADLVVLGQGERQDGLPADTRAGVPADFAESVMARSGRPALVVPYAGSFERAMDNVVIAWKETPESARAVAAALPLLRHARQVHVLTWGWQGGAVEGAALDLPGYLRLHGIESQWHAEPHASRDLGEQLLSRVSDFSADLLVMGCYGHSRAREWVLGGVTRTVLESMTVPVLMSH